MSGPRSKVKETRQKSKPVVAATEENPEPSKAPLLRQIRQAHGTMRHVERGYREQRRIHLAQAVELGLKLADARKQVWDKFVGDDLWGNRRPKSPKQPEAVRCVVLWYYASDKRGAKQASDVWTAVKYLLDQGQSPEAISSTIKNGPSIRTLCDKARKQSKIATRLEREQRGAVELPEATRDSKEAEGAKSAPSKQVPARMERISEPTHHRSGSLLKGKTEARSSASGAAKGTSKINPDARSAPLSKQSDTVVVATLRFKKDPSTFLTLPRDSRVHFNAVVEKMNDGCVLRVKSFRKSARKSNPTVKQ